MKLKIGIVLSNFPVISETFINTFLSHFEESEIYLFANISDYSSRKSNWNYKPYLSGLKNIKSVYSIVLSLLKIPFYLSRYKCLRKNGISCKRLIIDANIWTTHKLDYLHFPFATEIIGREHYASVIGAKNSISFRGSDVNVYPVFRNMSYATYWKYISKVHCNSEELLKILINEHSLPRDKHIEIIYPALREEFRISGGDLAQIINARSFEKEHFITIGRLHWVKDYPLIFQTLGQLKKEGLQFQYSIIGNGPEKEHLLFLAKELNINENIRWVGSLSGFDVIEYLAEATLYLQSSLAEGFSNSCIEAQAMGLQCVVTNVSGMSVCIQQNSGGHLVFDRDCHSFSDAIKSLINDSQETRRHQGMKAALEVTSLFTREKQKEEWLNFFTN